MDRILNPDLTWALRALAQSADAQRALYPSFSAVADELATDFDDAFSRLSDDFIARNPDLVALDKLLEEKSGIPQYWSFEALDDSDFWAEIRATASAALVARGLSTFTPHPSISIYASQREVWNRSGRSGSGEGAKRTLLERLWRMIR